MGKWLPQEDIKMFKVICFAGTTEGKEMISYLCENNFKTIGCIATEYGKTLLTPSKLLTTYAKRMDEMEMKAFFAKEQPDFIVDATHPFATEVTKNIKAAAKKMQISYLRLLREEDPISEALYFKDEVEASTYLAGTSGNILVTTGSKNLSAFTSISDYKTRCYARVLSLPSVVTACQKLGFCGKNLFAMQGPFSEELNFAMLKEINASYLVSKESGRTGGFPKKVMAAKKANVKLIVIKRPKEEGMNFKECIKELLKQCEVMKIIEQSREETEEEIRNNQSLQTDWNDTSFHRIACIGIGMGDHKYQNFAADDYMKHATHCIGASRMLDLADNAFCEKTVAITAEAIFQKINEITRTCHCSTIAVLFSGDTGFFSGTKKLLPLLENIALKKERISYEIIPGISSLSYLSAKAKISYEDAKIISLHGKEENLLRAIKENTKVFAIFGKIDDLGNICKQLKEENLGDVLVTVGEDLGYPTESIQAFQAKDGCEKITKQLTVAFFEQDHAEEFLPMPGISDDSFLRDKVPMTKEEIRVIAISKLKLTANAIVYDIGAGTGSVAIEMERLLKNGRVYAIEKKEAALELLKKNKEKFNAKNMQIVSGTAPDALEELEAPTHVFIGGSSGNLDEILSILLQKNPMVRIVITAITLETIAKVLEIVKNRSDLSADIAYVTVAKAKKAADYHMMIGQNPVAIFTIFQENISINSKI